MIQARSAQGEGADYFSEDCPAWGSARRRDLGPLPFCTPLDPHHPTSAGMMKW